MTRIDPRGNRKRELIELYDSTAGIYDNRYKEIQYRKYEHIENALTGPGGTLDVGCGTGLLLCLLGRRTSFLVGVDSSTKMLQAALMNTRAMAVKADLIRADAESLPLRNAVFSNIASVTVLQNLVKPRRGIREIARVTNGGGRIALTCLKKKQELSGLKRMVLSSSASLRITSEWDNGEEDIGVNATKLT